MVNAVDMAPQSEREFHERIATSGAVDEGKQLFWSRSRGGGLGAWLAPKRKSGNCEESGGRTEVAASRGQEHFQGLADICRGDLKALASSLGGHRASSL